MKTITQLLILLLLSFQISSAFLVTDKNLKNLQFGKENEDVKQLQIFLNENGFNDVEEGPGSPDNETKTFGAATRDAIKIFQEYNEMPITGKVDFATGRAINNYLKEIEEEEENYKGDSEEGINKYVTKDEYAENGIDKYKFEYGKVEKDITDTYINTATKTNPSSYMENKSTERQTLKDLFENTSRNMNKTTPTPTLFERFFSIFTKK